MNPNMHTVSALQQGRGQTSEQDEASFKRMESLPCEGTFLLLNMAESHSKIRARKETDVRQLCQALQVACSVLYVVL